MLSSFHPHSMWYKFQRIIQKTWCTSCTNWTIHLKVWGFRSETTTLQRQLNFWNPFNSKFFMCSTWSIHSHILKCQTFLTSSDSFNAFNDLLLSKKTLKLKSTANEVWNGLKLAWYHNLTHIACAKKLRGLREKLDALRVQTGQSPSKYQGFRRKLVYYKGISFF